jgi:uncharacterized membrane protein
VPAPSAESLRSIPFFAELGDEDLATLAATLTQRELARGETVFKQGDPGTSMFLVERGRVQISLVGEDKKRISLKEIGRGGVFGELAVFDDKPRSADAKCTSAAVLVELSRETLEAFVEKRPRAAIAIARTLSERLRETNAMLTARAAKNVDAELDQSVGWKERLADRVAELNGSWSFIIMLVGLTTLWCVINTKIFFDPPLDPYPFQFFNLALAILVGLQGPLIVMSQNRQALKDRARAETGFKVNLKNEVNIEAILRELESLRLETRRGVTSGVGSAAAPTTGEIPRPSSPT